MMKVKVYLTIGFPSASYEDVLEFDEGVSEGDIDQEVQEWAFNYIEYGWEKEEA